MRTTADDRIFSQINLPCGRRIQNRLVKVAMYEHLASFLGGPPNKYHYSLYSKWSESDWGMIITGNVQVASTHLSLGRDVVLPDRISETSLQPFRLWLSSIRGSSGEDVLAIMQLCHTGRQSLNFIGGRPPFQPPSAPSAISLKPKDTGWLSNAFHFMAFQTPRPMSLVDIDETVEAFVKGASVAFMSGFDGIQLHSAHGYLLAQFISPQSNFRTDEYSSHPDNALRMLHRVTSAIRAVVPKTFILGIKLNASDYVTSEQYETMPLGAEKDDRVLGHVRGIASWGTVDFIEVSGGDYENPTFMDTANASASPRRALFSRFSQGAVTALESLLPDAASPPPLILLTGGLRTPSLLHSALAENHAHLLGIGRGSVLCPNIPNLLKKLVLAGTHPDTDPAWSTPFRPEPDLRTRLWLQKYLPKIRLIGAGISMAWYTIMIRRLACVPSLAARKMGSNEPDYSIGAVRAVLSMWLWVDNPIRISCLGLRDHDDQVKVLNLLMMTNQEV